MTKLFWNVIKLSPVMLCATLLLANRTLAAEAPKAELAPNASVAATSVTTSPAESAVSSDQQLVAQSATSPVQNTTNLVASATPDSTAQVTSVSQLSNPESQVLAQVTSVSQLSDVQPTDWAFQALQSLVERYGCIAGYPDGTYRGNRALTRYEFAAGLNACLDRVNELIATATANQVTREDLATLQRLQEEFSAELATLRGRVDSLEAQTAELEANQFSTTTKLAGEAIFNVGGVFGEGRAVPSGRAQLTGPNADIDDNITFADRVRISLNTSFSGKDLLRARLQARNITEFGTNVTGTTMTRLGFDGDSSNSVAIDQLFYRFPLLNDKVVVQVDTANTELNERGFATYSPFESSGRGAISRYGRFSPIYRQGAGGAGVTVALNPQGAIGVNLAYLAPAANNPNRGFGVADGAYAAVGQVNFRLSNVFNLGLTYAHTYDSPRRRAINAFDQTGGVFANAPFGNVATSGNHYGVEASLRLSQKLIVFGWGGYSSLTAEDNPDAGPVSNGTTFTGNRGDNADVWYYAGGIALPDFIKEGSMLGVIFGQPPQVRGNNVREVAFGGRRRIDADTSYHLEGFYRYQLTDNIAITPGVLVIFNPEHNNDNDTEYVGTLRTTFTF